MPQLSFQLISAGTLSNNCLYLSWLNIDYGRKCGAIFHRSMDSYFGLRDQGQAGLESHHICPGLGHQIWIWSRAKRGEFVGWASRQAWYGLPLFPGGSDDKESACTVKDSGLIPGTGRSPGEGNGNPLQYSCLENPMDRGAWWAAVHGVAKSWTRLSDWRFHFLLWQHEECKCRAWINSYWVSWCWLGRGYGSGITSFRS